MHDIAWSIRILPARTLSSGALSYDKRIFLGVTTYGEVEAYSLVTYEFIGKILRSDSGPFRPIEMAIFYDRLSLLLFD